MLLLYGLGGVRGDGDRLELGFAGSGCATRRERAKPTTAATQAATAAAAQTQRAPTTSVSRPATIMPSISMPTFELISTANARPRSSSGAPRWTSSALQTTAEPLPHPSTTTQAAATQTFGATAAAPIPITIRPSEAP